MTLQNARLILDAVRCGVGEFPVRTITRALIATGDIAVETFAESLYEPFTEVHSEDAAP